ncbi:hypothetical protein ACFTTN_09420 [Streptomyces niveus]|uniref:hypothetical protein n=1 Tax=Streptomyces niveus TaxID=193462 RepID=UPI0036418B10
MAGRKLKPLPDDGHPRTEFAQALRELRELAGSPSYRTLVDKVGYTLATYSSIFNGDTLPERDQLNDLVGYLKGDTREWSRRLADAATAEERWNHSKDTRRENFAQIESLNAELEGYRIIANDPESVFAQAKRMQEDAHHRINFAREMELQLNTTLYVIDAQLDKARDIIPAAQAEAQTLLDQARATAHEIEHSARIEERAKMEKAQSNFDKLVARAEAEANRIIDKAGAENRRLRADTGRIVDQLLKEGEQYIEDARTERFQAELERQRGEALIGRLKLRAKFDLAKVIMEAQRSLANTGAIEQSEILDLLLHDLGITDMPSESENLRGRHRKITPRLVGGDAVGGDMNYREVSQPEAAENGSTRATDPPGARAALPRRRSNQKAYANKKPRS